MLDAPLCVSAVQFPGQPFPLYLSDLISRGCLLKLSSRSRVPLVEGVPAQNMLIAKPVLLSSSALRPCAFRRPATSHGLPMKTHGEGAASIIPSPSHGEAGEYREPVFSRSSSRLLLKRVLFLHGSSLSAPECTAVCMPSFSTQ